MRHHRRQQQSSWSESFAELVVDRFMCCTALTPHRQRRRKDGSSCSSSTENPSVVMDEDYERTRTSQSIVDKNNKNQYSSSCRRTEYWRNPSERTTPLPSVPSSLSSLILEDDGDRHPNETTRPTVGIPASPSPTGISDECQWQYYDMYSYPLVERVSSSCSTHVTTNTKTSSSNWSKSSSPPRLSKIEFQIGVQKDHWGWWWSFSEDEDEEKTPLPRTTQMPHALIRSS